MSQKFEVKTSGGGKHGTLRDDCGAIYYEAPSYRNANEVHLGYVGNNGGAIDNLIDKLCELRGRPVPPKKQEKGTFLAVAPHEWKPWFAGAILCSNTDVSGLDWAIDDFGIAIPDDQAFSVFQLVANVSAKPQPEPKPEPKRTVTKVAA